jgi:hypothetical protein
MSYLSVSREGYLIAEQTQQAYIKEAMAAYSRSLSEINDILKDTYTTALDQVDPEKYLQVMRKANRYEKLKAKITESYKSASKESAKLIKNSLSDAMTENYNRQQYLSSLTIDGFKAKALNDNLLNYAITGNVDVWKKIQTEAFEKIWGNPLVYSPQAGTLTDLLANNYTKELNAIMQSVQNGFITGKSYTDQAKGISKIIGDYLYKSGQESATGAMYNALRIARTEGARVMNAGALASANLSVANGAEITKRWIATLDSRTRDSHAALDGQEVGVNENFVSPVTGATGQAPNQMSLIGENINCRCSIIEIVKGFEPETRSSRNSDGESEIISYKNYDEWIKSNNL